MTPEKRFENSVKRFLHSVGIYPAGYPDDKKVIAPTGWYFKVWGGGYQKAGIPDMIINVRGYFVAVELKADNGTPSELQLKNIRSINDSSGFAFVLYPTKYDAFREFIIDLLHDKFNHENIEDIWK